jgi:hypothetical protein
MTPIWIDGQDRLGHHDHSLLTTFTSHLEAVGSGRLFGNARVAVASMGTTHALSMLMIRVALPRAHRIREGPHVAYATFYAGNWVRCMRLPILVVGSK